MRSLHWVHVVLVLGFTVHPALASSDSQQSQHKLKESILPPSGWTNVGPAHPEHGVELRIALPQPNFDELESHLYAVSDPFHERYGAHLSKTEVEALVAPRPESIDAVNQWLATHGILEDDLSRSPAQDWVTVTVPVMLAEKMLDTDYHVWVHDESGHTLVRTTSYSLPEHLHEHIDLVQPTTAFTRFTNQAIIHRLPVNATCNNTITIQCLKELYNAVNYMPSGSANGNQIAVTAYIENYANFDDLHMFYEDQVPAAAAANSSFSVVSINGGQNNQSVFSPSGEGNLDTQFAFGLTYPINATFFTTGGRPPINPFPPQTSNSTSPTPNLPQTISTSYADAEMSVPYSYALRVCRGFAQLGARGVSLLFCSGDAGVGDGDSNPATQTCFTAQNTTTFQPTFPPSCP
ncbi:Pro-kumamolisin, activation domain-containing protein [Amylocystis lapponica]|nr:Pro-kumamolisin, activation domain-containing protein [Amylocystis lapponica]